MMIISSEKYGELIHNLHPSRPCGKPVHTFSDCVNHYTRSEQSEMRSSPARHLGVSLPTVITKYLARMPVDLAQRHALNACASR